MSLNSLIDLTIHLNQLLKNHQALWGAVNQVSNIDSHEAMHFRQTKLILTEHEKQRKEGLCFYCGIANFVAYCSSHPRKHALALQAERKPAPSHKPTNYPVVKTMSPQCLHLHSLIVTSTSVENPNASITVSIPDVYHDLREVLQNQS